MMEPLATSTCRQTFAAIVERVAPSERGVALGTTSLFIDLGFGSGPVITGLVAGFAGYAAGFGVVGLVALAGAVGTAYAALDRHPAPATST
ncbi:MAG: MFS transporter [Candidatus Limnocylindria bacterium]